MTTRIKLILSAAAVVLCAIAAPQAHALTVSPPTFDYSLDPGNTALDVLKVYNEETSPVTFYPIVQNFTAAEGESGTPRFYPADEDPNGAALAQWVTLTEKDAVTIAPGERANIQFSINVPDNAQPGGHYGAIILSTNPPDVQQSGPAIGVGAQLGALLLARVSGEVKEDGRIAEFGFADPKVWYEYLPVDLFLRFENAGNTHLRPAGNVFIKDMLGRQVASIKVNGEFRSVLPKSIRRFSFGWKKADVSADASELEKEWRNFAFGRYTATLVLNYGNDNKLATETVAFYVWPWRVLLIALAILVIAITVLWRMLRAYNRWVIRRYQKILQRQAAKEEPKE